MNVSDELQKVFVLLADYGLIPVLEQVAASVMPEVEGYSVPREESAHESGEFAAGRPEQKVEMVRHQRPGQTSRLRFH